MTFNLDQFHSRKVSQNVSPVVVYQFCSLFEDNVLLLKFIRFGSECTRTSIAHLLMSAPPPPQHVHYATVYIHKLSVCLYVYCGVVSFLGGVICTTYIEKPGGGEVQGAVASHL